MKMNHRGIATVAICLVLCAADAIANVNTLPADLAAAGVEPAQIHVTGDTVYFRGEISDASTKAFKAAVGNIQRGEVTRLVISSVGGETRNGRKIGQWVHDMGLIVEVDRVCFSSCANYIFPAGRVRVIRANAFVGWHGNERGMEIDRRKRGVSLESEIRGMTPPEILTRHGIDLDEVQASMRKSIQDEAVFYAQLGMQDAFAMCAVGDAASSKYPSSQERKGWGFSIRDMERLGLVNTVYLGDGTYEKDSTFFRKYLGLLDADACLQLLSGEKPQQ